ncbi:metallophosphoesterase family protein [Brevibacillus centrosporus]|uniref:metallophosphoesterase family protein n=1 Tax=Brevibacillus centrosporus TaxID=54910 RepID=UPI002E1D7CDE|nr:metallophosphoesterase [Brevibacillus centrosporus]MED1953986.1 metallophosphoesterase [Brevibacillus centrosporus]
MRLMIMGDFHYSRMANSTEEMQAARDKAFSTMLGKFLEWDADLHISLGDLRHEGHPEELEFVFDSMESSGRPFIHVLGNHDTLSLPKTEILTITGQQQYHAIDMEEVMLLFIDTTKEMNEDDWGGEMDEEQLQWLQSQLETSGDKPVFIFAHHPVYATTARSTHEKGSIHPDINMKEVLKKKEGYGFYFCGHNHVNSIVQQEGWHYIQTAACLDIPAFRVVDLSEGKVKISHIPINDSSLADHIATFHKGMPGFEPTEKPHGEETDRSLVVEVLQSI